MFGQPSSVGPVPCVLLRIHLGPLGCFAPLPLLGHCVHNVRSLFLASPLGHGNHFHMVVLDSAFGVRSSPGLRLVFGGGLPACGLVLVCSSSCLSASRTVASCICKLVVSCGPLPWLLCWLCQACLYLPWGGVSVHAVACIRPCLSSAWHLGPSLCTMARLC